MPKQPCLEVGCGEVSAHRGRCLVHSKEHDRVIDRTGRAIYKKAKWRHTRERKLFLDPLCERCGKPATDVHHQLGVDVDPWALEYLESLCHSCHSRVTRREQLIRTG
jgi:5-methylcytosine-specific restriction endonuclease McrA